MNRDDVMAIEIGGRAFYTSDTYTAIVLRASLAVFAARERRRRARKLRIHRALRILSLGRYRA